MSPDELRIRVRALGGLFSGRIEALTDQIASHTTDPQMRFELTRFKINAIPVMQAALFEPDPVAALIDAWALLAQLEDAIAQRDVVRDARMRAMATKGVHGMERDVEAIWSALAGADRVPPARSRIHEWAKAHPVTKTLSAREPTAPLLANLTASSRVTPMGAIATVMQQMQDLQAWLSLQAAYLPKQARWQAEYLVAETAADPSLAAAASQVGDYLSDERRATLGALDRQRRDFQAFLADERKAMLDKMSSERAVVLDDVGHTGYSWIDHAFDRATALADRLFLRLLLLLALLVAGAIVALQVVVSGRRRRELLRRS
jgi:hypothetical protein